MKITPFSQRSCFVVGGLQMSGGPGQRGVTMKRLVSALLAGGLLAAAAPGNVYADLARESLGAVPVRMGNALTPRNEAGTAAHIWIQEQELQPRVAAPYKIFGWSVALSSDGQVAVVGAPGVNLSRGVAYVFVRKPGGWVLEQEIAAADGANFDNFGASVAVSADGRVVVVAAPRANSAGAAYVFVRHGRTWRQQQKLPAPGGTIVPNAAVAVSSDGDVVIVGAEFADNPSGVSTGAAYLFTREKDRWVEQQALYGSDSAVGDGFGYAVALSRHGAIAVIGTPYPNIMGAVYVFKRHGARWQQVQEIAPPSGSPPGFGESVALADDETTMLIGATHIGPGAGYLFVRNGTTWTATQGLEAADPMGAPFLFGSSVALSGRARVALIGALDAAYIFVASDGGWHQTQILRSPIPSQTDFGTAVALSKSGQLAVIGAYLTNNNAGSAYVFRNPHP